MASAEGTTGEAAATATAVATASPGTQTQTQTTTAATGGRQQLRLHLRAPQAEKKKVEWTEDTIDNEHLGRKSSKKCCIYHKPRAFDESSSDESDFESDHHDCDHDHGQDPT
eukprot:m.13202 g.13202  ORF g.13202 m.13202 type:complete len:112 (-) comp4487_c0_seq1:283-618(-)